MNPSNPVDDSATCGLDLNPVDDNWLFHALCETISLT